MLRNAIRLALVRFVQNPDTIAYWDNNYAWIIAVIITPLIIFVLWFFLWDYLRKFAYIITGHLKQGVSLETRPHAHGNKKTEPLSNSNDWFPKTKKCPFCAEKIQAEAMKCKHCGEWLNKICVPSVNDKQSKEVDKVTQVIITAAQSKEKGFGWGHFWIVMGFLQGGIALIFGFIFGITTEYIPNRGTGLIIGILGIGSAYFLLKRKKLGLYFVYLILLIALIGGLFDTFTSDPGAQNADFVKGLFFILTLPIWFLYFWRRRAWFSAHEFEIPSYQAGPPSAQTVPSQNREVHPDEPSVTGRARDITNSHLAVRFIAIFDGVVLDTKTNLMWAAQDNGSNINWANAKSYCKNYRGGGYSDWRMPTQYELAGLYDVAKTYQSDSGVDIHLTELIHLSCTAPWASATRYRFSGSEAANFYFSFGARHWFPQTHDGGFRALPVRNAQ